MTEAFTPAMMSEFDQSYAYCAEVLAQLVTSYITGRDENAEQGYPAEATMVWMSRYLVEDWGPDELASALTVAVVKLADG